MIKNISKLIFVLFLFQSTIADCQIQRDSGTYQIQLDFSRLLYKYSSLEFSLENKISSRIGLVGEVNLYLGFFPFKEKEIQLSGLKVNSFFGNFRLSSGINYYFDQNRFFLRGRLSYGYQKLFYSRYVCTQIEEVTNPDIISEIVECLSYHKDEMTRSLHQLMARVGIGCKLISGRKVHMAGYVDFAIAKYYSKDSGQICNTGDCIEGIDAELFTFERNEIVYSDGILQSSIENPILFFQFGLKISYEL